jgi:hypothetical protein
VAQGCQMVYFQTENPNLGKFWRALEWKMLAYFLTIWNILWPFGKIYGRLVWVVCCDLVYYYYFNLVYLDQEKSGNPGVAAEKKRFGYIQCYGWHQNFIFGRSLNTAAIPGNP